MAPFDLSRPVSNWNEAKMIFRLEMKPGWCFKIFLMFLQYFWEFFSSGRIGTVWNKNFFFSLFQPVPTHFGLKWCQEYIFQFFEFFWEFSSLVQVGTDRNGKKKFLSFSACHDPFWLEMMPGWCFLIFWIFLLFFWVFSSSVQVETDRNEKKKFLSFSACHDPFRPVPTRSVLKWS